MAPGQISDAQADDATEELVGHPDAESVSSAIGQAHDAYQSGDNDGAASSLSSAYVTSMGGRQAATSGSAQTPLSNAIGQAHSNMASNPSSHLGASTARTMARRAVRREAVRQGRRQVIDDNVERVTDSALSNVELAAPAAVPSGKPYSESLTAPGAKPLLYGQLRRQVPDQNVSASPPLPPGVALPTPKEIRALIPLVADSPARDQTHARHTKLTAPKSAHVPAVASATNEMVQ